MLTAVATRVGHSVEVRFVAVEQGENSHSDVPPKDGPSPIAPETKELAWSAGAFIVFAVLMRLVLYPRLKAGMDARYAGIRSGHEQADATRASARAEVTEYQTQLAAVKSEANERIDVARRTLEQERADRLAEVNGRINERRQEMLAAAEEARIAARPDVETAAADVAARVVELATGRRPDDDVVQRAVADSMMEGAQR